jgi:hypothetical protein
MATKMQEMEAELARLKAENAALQAAKQGVLSMRQGKLYECLDGEKLPTAVFSLYGLGRFPVSLYDTQWERLFGYVEEARKVMQAAKEAGKLPTPAQVVKQKADRKARKLAEE